jgi:uncharacterized protein YuzE
VSHYPIRIITWDEENKKIMVQYFSDTDTLLMMLNDNPVAETRDFNENTLIDVDENGNLVNITIEHAKERAGIPNFSYQLAA